MGHSLLYRAYRAGVEDTKDSGMASLPTLEIHLENYSHALHIENRGHQSDIYWLLAILKDHKIHPIIYVLEDWKTENPEDFNWLSTLTWATLKSHGVHHYHDEKADRSPYFNQEGYPFPPSGGFFFRFLPLWYIKWAIRKSGTFWVHPFDFDEGHPKLKNLFLNFKRHIGLKKSKAKLEKLLQEVKFA